MAKTKTRASARSTAPGPMPILTSFYPCQTAPDGEARVETARLATETKIQWKRRHDTAVIASYAEFPPDGPDGTF